jgi:hypothetical protein
MRFEVLTAVKISMLVFWMLTPCCPEDRAFMFLCNVDIYL